MAQPVTFTKVLTAPDSGAVALPQKPVAAGGLTINGNLSSGGVATLDTQRRVLVSSDGNDSSVTVTLYGTNDGGSGVKDSVSGPNVGNVASAVDFKTISRVTISAAATGNISVGTNTTGSTPFVLFNSHLSPPALAIGMKKVTGNVTADIEYTYEDFFQPIPAMGSSPAIQYAPNSPNPKVYLHPQLHGITTDQDGNTAFPMRGWRMTVTAGTGTMQVTGIQAGISGP